MKGRNSVTAVKIPQCTQNSRNPAALELKQHWLSPPPKGTEQSLARALQTELRVCGARAGLGAAAATVGHVPVGIKMKQSSPSSAALMASS